MKRIFFSIVILSFTAAIALAQNTLTVTGTVSDDLGEPLIGATVKALGTKEATVTDMDGKYTLTVTPESKQLEVSYIGYKTQEYTIKGGKGNIKMSPDNNTLNEVVAIGYGSVKRGDITNAVSKVKAEDLADRPVTNIGNALQGELAGVDIQSTSGAPGSEVQIKVRGATSINEDASSDPLYIVDGVPMDDNFNLNDLNPQDIQSIEVLKDASSSAIYGSRGANGVILITSKSGRKDSKTNVNVNTNFSISYPERLMDIMSSEEWIKWRQKSNDNTYAYTYACNGAQAGDSYVQQLAVSNGSASTSSVSDPRWKIAGYGGLSLVDWQKAMFRPAFAQSYNISVNSGNKTSSYRASVGFANQKGIVIETGMNRLNLNLIGTTTIKNHLTLTLNVAPQMVVTNGGNVDGKDNTAMNALTLVPVVEQSAGLYTASEPYSRYIYAGSTVSPVAMMKEPTYRDEQIRFQSSFKANYKFNKFLNVEVLGSWIYTNRERRIFTPSTVYRNWSSGEGYAAKSSWIGSRSHKYLVQATASYDCTYGQKHHVNVVGGWALESTQDATSYSLAATQFPNNTLQGWAINDVEATKFTTSLSTDNHLISYFARAEYGYDSRYLFNISIRRDGSSRFGSKRKWGTFPAISVAWRANNEKFWNPKWVWNQAKLRISYGLNGTNSISSNAADGLLTTSYYSSDGTLTTGYIPLSTSNPNLGWQKTNSWNIGADLSFFQNRISMSLDYYLKNISDMLYQVSLPTVIGYSTGWSNIGNIRTQGFEAELKTEILTGILRWTTNLVAGYSTNKVTDLGDNSAIYTGYKNETQIIQVGHPVGEYYMYIADGVYKTADDLAKYPIQASSVIGSVRYRDVNGDGVITSDDRTYVGHPQPSWTFGLNNSFKWKKWDASILITAQTGGRIWSALGRAIDMQYQGNSINRLTKWKNMWMSQTKTGDGSVPSAVNTYGSTEEEFSTRWLYSTDFIKIKNITIGYRFNFSKVAFFNSLRLTASIENLLMIDSYNGGYSPESNNSGSSVRVYDYGAYPSARTFSIGINLGI
jgi:TonB-linked SusC/RagA family outer membrane protein